MKSLKRNWKKWAVTGGAIFGLVILVAAIFRARKDSADGGNFVASLGEKIKEAAKFSVIAIAAALSYYFGGEAGLITAVALGTLTSGAAVVTTFNSTYLPKYMTYVAATQLTGVKITAQGDGVIFDSDAVGLNHLGVIRLQGQATTQYVFTLANGFIQGKNIIWEFTNSAAQNPVIYVSSDETKLQSPMYMQLLRQAVLANSGQTFTDFASISFPSIGATDQVNILYNDGTQQQLNRVDLTSQLCFTQNIVNNIFTIDNFAMRIKSVNIIGAAQTAYVQRWQPASGIGMISQVVNG